jgi:type IV pilus assembly protein PilV
MLEVLIALLVLSIGLAGLAAMQLSSLQYVHSAHYRSMASAIALDFEERMWIAVSDGTMPDCPSQSTLRDELAAYWSSQTASMTYGADSAPQKLVIPNLLVTVGNVVEDTTNSPVKTIPLTFSWAENRFSDEESTTESFTYNARILCRQSS